MNTHDLDFDLRGVFAILRRQSRLIVMTVVIVMAMASLYVLTATPLYRAEALLLVDPSEQNLLDPNKVTSLAASTLNARVDSEVEILRSASTALAMVEAADLVADPEFGPRLPMRAKLAQAIGLPRGAQDADGASLLKGVVSRFMNARDVHRQGLTYVISVGVTSESPERAAVLANTLAETYILEQVQAKVRSTLAGRDVLQGQITHAQHRLATTEGQLDGYIFDNLERLERESGEKALIPLRQNLSVIQSLQQSQGKLMSEAQSALAGRNWVKLTSALENDALAELERQRQALERRLGAVASGSSLAMDLQDALDEIESGLEAEAGVRLRALQEEVFGFDKQIESVRDEIRTTLLRSDLPTSTLAEVFTLQQEAELARHQYQTLLSRLSELEAQAAVQIADSRIVSEALPPTRASQPDKRLVLTVAMVSAVMLGVTLAFANEFCLGGVTSEGQLENILQSPVLGSVPETEQARGTESVADRVVDQPLSAYSEALRQVRASIDQTLRKRGTPPEAGVVILVSSAVPAEGKTTTALALARTYAQSGTKTLLIDADLRKPALARHLGVRPEGSILHYLSAAAGGDEGRPDVTKDPRTSLQTLLSETRSEIPTDQLVGSARFRAMIDAARADGRVVIVDSPPVLPVVDARYMASQADLVVQVVRFGATKQSEIRYAFERFRSATEEGTPVFGLLSHQEWRGKDGRYQAYYADNAYRADA